MMSWQVNAEGFWQSLWSDSGLTRVDETADGLDFLSNNYIMLGMLIDGS